MQCIFDHFVVAAPPNCQTPFTQAITEIATRCSYPYQLREELQRCGWQFRNRDGSMPREVDVTKAIGQAFNELRHPPPPESPC